jgi:glycosyltransferase involved in cell wall biosynthesis
MHFCTIVARNYVAAARVLARSLAEHNPGAVCWTLVIDDLEHEVREDEQPFRVLAPEELRIERWDAMTAGYSVLELSTAVKPWLLRHLLHERDVKRIVYLDPDIQVFDSLAEIDELLGSHPVVVNPHLTAPIPRDDRRPTETDILSSGSFNLGFAGFAAGPEVDRLLDWWGKRLESECLVAPELGYFVDQRWMDLAPGLVDRLHILRDPGYNVAYWNLPSRTVRREGDRYTVNSRPLRFFHFSGYDPNHPERLSKHQDRIALREQPALRALCHGYARALDREGNAHWRPRPYGWGALPDGTVLDDAARAVYRAGARAGELDGQSVFAEPGATALVEYLRGPAEHGGDRGVSRYLAAIREQRRDLRDLFVDLDGPDGARFAGWAQLSSEGLPQNLLIGGNGHGGPRAGVNAAGYFTGVMGTGEHGRQLVGALEAAGVPVTLTLLHPDAAPEDPGLDGAERQRPRADSECCFNLLCANADSVREVARSLGGDYFAERYTIGFWAWEVSAFPERYLGAFQPLDEVWVGSRHVLDAIAPLAPVPVLAIPQPVSLPPSYARDAPPPGLPAGFRFLFAFDYLSVFERKNPLGVVEAFQRAFAAGSGATLILKTLNHDRDPAAHERLRAATAGHPDIHLLEQRLSAGERNGLMNAADCYVSLHRAEGFGYTMAESMWAGKPVIATGYSGNLDFMNAGNSYLVEHQLVPIGFGRDPYPASGLWAEPDVGHAAALMREVYEHPDEARRRGERAAAEIRASHGPEVAGRFMVERLSRILMSTQARHNRGGPLYTDWVSGMIESGPVPAGRPRFGPAQRAARKGLLRVLKPLSVHERLIDSELLDAIEKLDVNIQGIAAAQRAAARRISELEDALREPPEEPRPD